MRKEFNLKDYERWCSESGLKPSDELSLTHYKLSLSLVNENEKEFIEEFIRNCYINLYTSTFCIFAKSEVSPILSLIETNRDLIEKINCFSKEEIDRFIDELGIKYGMLVHTINSFVMKQAIYNKPKNVKKEN